MQATLSDLLTLNSTLRQIGDVMGLITKKHLMVILGYDIGLHMLKGKLTLKLRC